MALQMMIDIETFDTRPSAVVFQVGVVVFQDPYLDSNWEILHEKIYHLDIVEQIVAGRSVDQDTQLFWAKQNKSAWDRGSNPTVQYRGMLDDLVQTVKHWKVGKVWSNSPSFDAVIMRSLHEDIEISSGEELIPFPFDFRKDMDLRTIKQMLMQMDRMDGYAKPGETTHNALVDCRDQVHLLGFMLGELKAMEATQSRYENGDITDSDTAGILPRNNDK